MKLTQKESIKKELRLFNYDFSKFAVLAKSVTTSRIFGASDLDQTVVALRLQICSVAWLGSSLMTWPTT
jgi:hypothetical protein